MPKILFCDIGGCKKLVRMFFDGEDITCFDERAGILSECPLCSLFLDDDTLKYYRQQYDLMMKAELN